uniref:Uncharacterized protein n=1 Tax=Glossina austeni TaxID=7395 RepID=A0A1A9VH57_GLOAU
MENILEWLSTYVKSAFRKGVIRKPMSLLMLLDKNHKQRCIIFINEQTQHTSQTAKTIPSHALTRQCFKLLACASRSRDRLVVRTLRCGRSNPGSNPGHGNDFEHESLSRLKSTKPEIQ